MGDIFGGMTGSGGGLGSLTGGLSSLLGGGQPASGSGGDASSLLGGGGTDIFSSVLGSGTGGLFGMDPSVGASYAMQGGGGGGGGGAGGYQDPGSQGGDPSEPQPPIPPQQQQPVRQTAYQPPPQPTDPQAWQVGGGGGRVLGPTGFVQQPMGNAEGRAIMQGTAGLPSWMRSGATSEVPEGQGFKTPSEIVDQRFPETTPNENVDRRFLTDVQEQQGRGYNTSGTGPGVAGQAVADRTGEMQPPSAAETPTEPEAKPDQQPPAPTARPPAQPGVPPQGGVPQQRGVPQQGGLPQRPMPNLGRLFQDIQGAMSGNPQSLLNLAQTVMGMAGGQQGGQQGGPPPWMPGYGPGQPYGTQLRPQDRPGLQQALDYYRRTGQMPPGMQPQRGGQQQPAMPGKVAPEVTQSQPSGDQNAPSRQPDGKFPQGYQQVAPIVSRTLSSAGLPDKAIKGILFNVGTESAFNPTNRHFDQPRYARNHPGDKEGAMSHGLYQEGAEEWNRYHRWLGGRDWRDPQLQTQFIAQNMRQNYPRLWTRLQNAQSKEEAARLFARDYLKPSNRNLIERFARINRGI